MLPGFRFLFGAIVLSVSILIFGVGAAALLRAAHEEFASNPSWRPPAEPMFAQREATRPLLAVLQVNPPASAAPVPTAAPTAWVTAPGADPSAPTGPERGLSPENGKAEASAVETSKPVEALAAPAGVAAILTDNSASIPADASAPSTRGQELVLGQAPNEPTALPGAPPAELSASTPSPDTPSTSLAALGDESVSQTKASAAQVPTRATSASAETEAKKRARAEREKERRRAAQRARTLTQAAVQEPGAAALSPKFFEMFPPPAQPTPSAGQPAPATSRKR